MERGQVEGVADGVDHLVVDERRLGEPLAAVDHAVPDGADLGEHVAARAVGLAHPVEQVRERRRVVGGLERHALGLGAAEGERGERRDGPDALDLPGRQRRPGLGVDEVDLERRRAGVEDEDGHEEDGGLHRSLFGLPSCLLLNFPDRITYVFQLFPNLFYGSRE